MAEQTPPPGISFSGSKHSAELAAFLGCADEGAPWDQVPGRDELAHPSLIELRETLKWAGAVAQALERRAKGPYASAHKHAKETYLRALMRVYSDATGRDDYAPYNDTRRGLEVGTFLDFVSPAIVHLEDNNLGPGGVAQRIKRLLGKDNRARGIKRAPKKRGRKPKK